MAKLVVPAAASVIEYAWPALGLTSMLPPQTSAEPAFEPFSCTWKRSPLLAAPFGQDFVTVTFGGAVSLFLNVHVALVAVVPAATVAVAALPLKVQFVPVPESKV